MRKYLLLLSALCVTIIIAIPVEEGDFREFLYGHSTDYAYDNWQSHVAENIARHDYNRYPFFDRQTNGFGDYTVPSTEELIIWNEALDYFMRDNLFNADTVLNNSDLPFEVLEMRDLNSDRIYNVLREIPNRDYYDDNATSDPIDDEIGAFIYSWGLVVKNPDSRNPIIISVVHPCDDFIAIPVAYEAFKALDARYLIINGAGREVRFSGSATSFVNNRSISDPSRNAAHPYNSAYQRACNEIRENFGCSEFVLQLHSYDYTSSINSDVIVSAGSNVFPALPIYDLSSRHHDMINSLPYNIPISGYYDQNQENTVIDYISTASYNMHWLNYPRYFTDNGDSYWIQNQNTYWGYSYSTQYRYTKNNCDSFIFKNWVHVEMREAPNYSDDIRKYYGYDLETETIDWKNRFDAAIEYNSHWINSLAFVLPDVLQKNDGETPPLECTPLLFEHSTFMDSRTSCIGLQWQQCDDFNFKEYRVEIANDSLFSDAELICNPIEDILQHYTSFDHSVIQQKKWFRVKAYDYDDNFSVSNILFIDTDLNRYSYANQPGISYQIQVENSESYINVMVENEGNYSMVINDIEELSPPFYCRDFQTPVIVPSCSIKSFKVYIDTSLPGSYSDTFKLNITADNTNSLLYLISANVPEFENIYSIAELRNTNNGMILTWHGNGEPEAIYDVYFSDKPDGEYRLIEHTTETYLPIQGGSKSGFYRIIAK
jgi:hypothetical protein